MEWIPPEKPLARYVRKCKIKFISIYENFDPWGGPQIIVITHIYPPWSTLQEPKDRFWELSTTKRDTVQKIHCEDVIWRNSNKAFYVNLGNEIWEKKLSLWLLSIPMKLIGPTVVSGSALRMLQGDQCSHWSKYVIPQKERFFSPDCKTCSLLSTCMPRFIVSPRIYIISNDFRFSFPVRKTRLQYFCSVVVYDMKLAHERERCYKIKNHKCLN